MFFRGYFFRGGCLMFLLGALLSVCVCFVGLT